MNQIMKMTKVIVNFYYRCQLLECCILPVQMRVAISFTAFVNTRHKKTLMKR